MAGTAAGGGETVLVREAVFVRVTVRVGVSEGVPLTEAPGEGVSDGVAEAGQGKSALTQRRRGSKWSSQSFSSCADVAEGAAMDSQPSPGLLPSPLQGHAWR